MASWEVSDPNLELEGSSLGRGSGFYDAKERRRYEVETVELGCWHVEDSGPRELPKGWSGQVSERDKKKFSSSRVLGILPGPYPHGPFRGRRDP